MNARIEALTSVRGFARGIFWNMLGRGAPILVAVAATPVLLGQLGVDRWGVFALALSIVGSFGILDFGVSAALTRALAERIGTPEEQDAPALLVTALAVLGLTSVAGSAAAFAAVPWFVDGVLHVPPALRGEVILAFHLLAASGPLIIVNAALWGVLAAYQRFRAANLIGIPVAAMYFVGPILLLMVRDSLAMAVAALIAVRLAQTVICTVLILRLVPEIRGPARIEFRLLRYLVRIGAWVTISNTLAPLMTYADRFIVGATVSLAAVSHYVTPVDLVWRLILVPVAIATALFPAIATSHRRQPERVHALMRTGSLIVIVTIFPVCVVLVGLGRELMTLWLGAAFAADSHVVLAIVGGGVFFSCLAALPATMLDGIGRPEIGAYFLIGQAFLFPGAVAAMALTFGIEGAAAVWSIRAAANCVGRFYLCGRLRPALRPTVRTIFAVSLAGGAALVACALIEPLPLRLVAMLAAALLVPAIAARRLLEAAETNRLGNGVRAALRLVRVIPAKELVKE